MKNKVRKLVIIAVFGVAMLCAGNVMALPFGVNGSVNQNYGGSWDATTGKGTAQFSFSITDDSLITGGVNVNRLSIAFDSDIFVGLDTTDFTILNPGGWMTSVLPGSSLVFSISSATSTPLTTANSPLVLNLDYALSDVAAYNNASGPGWNWDKGQAWGLGFTMEETVNIPRYGPLAVHSGGGNTASVVPEPGTIALLGAGMAGLVGVGMRRRTKKKAA